MGNFHVHQQVPDYQGLNQIKSIEIYSFWWPKWRLPADFNHWVGAELSTQCQSLSHSCLSRCLSHLKRKRRPSLSLVFKKIYVYCIRSYKIFNTTLPCYDFWLMTFVFEETFECSQLFSMLHALACTNDYECMGTSLEVLLAYNTNFILIANILLRPSAFPWRMFNESILLSLHGSLYWKGWKILWKCDSQIPTDLSGWFHPPQLLPRYPVDASASHGVSFHPSPDSTFHGVCRGSRTDSPSNRWDIQQLLLQKVKIKININCWSSWRQII